MIGSMTVAQYAVRQMQAWGIETVFGVPGDTLLPLLEELRRAGSPRFIVCRHEGSAAMMASAYAKLTGRVAACLADAGPGAVQMLNGVYDAWMDRVPLLAITGELPAQQRGLRWPQDAGLDALFREATAFSHTLSAPGQACAVFAHALRKSLLASRPVRIGVPADMWTQGCGPVAVELPPKDFGGRVETRDDRIREAAAWLESARRPVLFAGLGCRGAAGPLLALAERLQAPIVHSMPAIGMLPPEHPWNLGVVGKFGTQAAADVLAEADVILAAGTTWWQPEFFPAGARVIQVDRAVDHIGYTFPVDLGVWGDAGDVLSRLAEATSRVHRPEWAHRVAHARRAHEAEAAEVPTAGGPLHPAAVVQALSGHLVPDAVVALDVGNHAFWFSRYYRGPQVRVLLSGHWRSTGFALPAGIGAKLAAPARQVVVFAGDGGFAMSMAELATAVQHGLPIACIVLRDGRYAEEESLQRRLGREPFGTRLHNPDWAAYAHSCGVDGYRVETFEQLTAALARALPALAQGRAAVLDVAVAAVEPRYARPGQAFRDGRLLDAVLAGAQAPASR